MNRRIHQRKMRVATANLPLPFVASVSIVGALVGVLIVLLSFVS
jgi:hypothetical protein